MANNTLFDIKVGVDEIKEILEDKAKMKTIKVEVKDNSFFGEYIIKTDAKRLQQVLLNLYSNAIKFTNRNGNINIILEKIFRDGINMVKIEVQDDGIGIKKED